MLIIIFIVIFAVRKIQYLVNLMIVAWPARYQINPGIFSSTSSFPTMSLSCSCNNDLDNSCVSVFSLHNKLFIQPMLSLTSI